MKFQFHTTPNDCLEDFEKLLICVAIATSYVNDLDEIHMIHKIIMKSLDPSRAEKIFIRKNLGHTAVSAIKTSSVTL